MPWSSFSGALSTPKVDVGIDMGNPFLKSHCRWFFEDRSATRAIAEDSYRIVKGEHALKKMCKEGAYWGTVAGVYVGMECGVEKVRDTKDWFLLRQPLSLDKLRKNAMIGGALTGALVSAAGNDHKDKVVMDALAGGAIAIAAEFLRFRN